MHIRCVDITSDDDLARYHAVYAASNSLGRPHATTWPYPEFVSSLRAPSRTWQRLLLLAEQEGEVDGVAELELPLVDNLHLLELMVHVRPERRRRGVGTALAARLRVEAEAKGRRLASSWVTGIQLRRDGTPVDEREAPGDAFARSCGLTLRNTNVHRILPLPVAIDVLDGLAAAAAPHHSDYRIVGFTGACPAELVDGYCRLKAAMVVEAPMGDLEIEPEVWDQDRLREEEHELTAMGRTRLNTFAMAPDGAVAGFNELMHSEHDVGNVYNWDTLVVPAHRGHRLGLALKVANLRRFQHAYSDGRRVHTHNAAQNGPMVAVNDAVGFVAVERVGEWQGPVSGLPGGAR